ncbi:uncharacterized protein LOC130087386 [Rhinichthys klamathensis goyatoka]|uniref:uncharacterized protein LOC130087386 n=1 Tax=Rhinichthys klamathensis goyatoka TaxID=3034132 RepID=UPI0024B587EF|nr:uncharacterized protein LOC130087386 [Rhinichthys klamathensis goyatoka]
MAANLNVDGARLLIGEDSATIGVEEDTTQGKLVTPPGVPGLCVTEKAAVPNDLITEVSLPLSGDNSGSKPCDGGVAVTQQDSPQATTAPNLDPESNGKSGEKRERESDNTSGIPVKRRLRLSEDTEQEGVHDYDARCAELWIDGEIAACEAYELSQASSNARRQYLLRDPRQANNGVRRNNNSSAQPVTQLTVGPQTTITTCFKEFIKVFRQTEVLRRADFAELINLVRGMQRDFRVLSNEIHNTRVEIHNIRVDQRQMLDAFSLMLERLNVIQMYVTDTHKTMMGNK